MSKEGNQGLPESMIKGKHYLFMSDTRIANQIGVCFCDAEEDGKRMGVGGGIGAWSSASGKGGDKGITHYPQPKKYNATTPIDKLPDEERKQAEAYLELLKSRPGNPKHY